MCALENAIECAVVLGSTGSIQLEDLPEEVREWEADGETVEALNHSISPSAATTKFNDTIRETKKRLISDALKQANNNITEAARLLGMHPNNLHRLMKNLKLKN